MFQQKDSRDRIKTLGDAVIILGNNNKSVIDFNEIFDSDCSKDIIAFSKLKIIVEALNEGWKPTFDEDECHYYPWFSICSKKEYEKLNEEQKQKCRVVGRSNNASNCGLAAAYSYYAWTDSISLSSSRLTFKTRELAEYCGKQFIDIWEKFLFA